MDFIKTLRFKNSGFTLIELTMVIVIIAIIALITIPRMMKISAKAEENSDYYVINATKTALYTKLQEYILSGKGTTIQDMFRDYYCPTIIFELLDNPPPYQTYVMEEEENMDLGNGKWVINSVPESCYIIYCPHYKPGKKGIKWGFAYESCPEPFHEAGDLWLINNLGH